MKRIKYTLLCLLVFSATTVVTAQDLKEYAENTDREKIKKSIVMGPGNEPVTAKGFGDGHGKNVLLTSKNQVPDTVALTTFYIYDLGSNTVSRGGHTTYFTYTWLSAAGGNEFANAILKDAIGPMKEAFRKQGHVLLTPDEFLNTPAKREYYYKRFAPEVSKLGKFLGDIETKHADIFVGADGYRVLDISMSGDALRSQSMGGDLCKALGVSGVLSVAVELQSGKKSVDLHGFKVSLHGPNPVPKEDKKYVAQKLGNGYYEGQLYTYGSFFLKKPAEVATMKKDKIEGMDFTGAGTILSCFIEKFYETMYECSETAAKKYGK